jgi:uncharacterized membrane protein
MENLQKLVLIIHIVSGFTALAVGIIPMAAKKGSRLHISAGRIYVWAMYLVAASAVMTFLLKPYRPFLVYLTFIGVFSFYLTYTGAQLVRQKATYQATLRDWIISMVALLSGVAMLALSGWHFLQADIFFGTLYVVFGVFLTSISFRDIQRFRGRANYQKMEWFFLHISRMVGAYIATFTAFCVVNASKVDFIHPLAAWLAPGLIGGIAISRWIAYYRKKM